MIVCHYDLLWYFLDFVDCFKIFLASKVSLLVIVGFFWAAECRFEVLLEVVGELASW